MHLTTHACALLLLATAGSVAAPSVRAAESYDSCTGFIDSLPATIATQGVWCLRKDLSTAMSSGAAITIAANNVTIDCNGFKVGGLAGGDASTARGVLAANRQNAAVRNCALRGFHTGVEFTGDAGGGHLVEANRINQSLSRGIYVEGENNLVRDNRVFDTGGAPGATAAWGMGGSADFIGNIISGGFAAAESPQYVYGIMVVSGVARDNIVRGLVKDEGATGAATGIHVGGLASGVLIRGNSITAIEAGFSGGYGIWGINAATSICADNLVMDYTADIGGCQDAGGNASN